MSPSEEKIMFLTGKGIRIIMHSPVSIQFFQRHIFITELSSMGTRPAECLAPAIATHASLCGSEDRGFLPASRPLTCVSCQAFLSKFLKESEKTHICSNRLFLKGTRSCSFEMEGSITATNKQHCDAPLFLF